jgi:hypothetical protein
VGREGGEFLLSISLVPWLDFSAIPVSISAVSLGRLLTSVYFYVHYSNIATDEF